MTTIGNAATLLFLILAELSQANSLDTWTWLNPLPTGNDLSSVCYGNGMFVAVGGAGTILTSADGAHWVQRQSAIPLAIFKAVGYGDGRFVAIGQDPEVVAASTDGVSWVPGQPMGLRVPGHVSGIAYDSHQFVAVWHSAETSSGFFETSPDGLNWLQCPSPYQVGSITYGADQFVAVGPGGVIVTSPDGITWTKHDIHSRSNLESIAFGGDRFVALGPGVSLTSTNGIDWDQNGLGTNATLFASLAYGDGQFVAIGSSGTYGQSITMTSDDGVNWTKPTVVAVSPYYDPHGSSITFGNGRFVAVGADGTIASSTDAQNWITPQTNRIELNLTGIAYGKGRLVIVGWSDGPMSTILSSADAIAWTQTGPAIRGLLERVIYEHGQFVAVGAGILTSSDGVTWVERESASSLSGGLWAVSFGNGQYVAAGDNGLILTSSDGMTWLQRQAGTAGWLAGIAFGNGRFVAVGGNTIVTSTDALTWTLQEKGTALRDVAYGSGRFVAVGANVTDNEIFSSSDGINWVRQTAPIYCNLGPIAYGNGQFVVAACSPISDNHRVTIMTSSDGSNWAEATPFYSYPLGGLAFVNGRFMGVGQNGAIVQSGPIVSLSMEKTTAPFSLELSLHKPLGLACTVQASEDLISWRNLTDLTAVANGEAHLEVLPQRSQRLFYRASAP